MAERCQQVDKKMSTLWDPKNEPKMAPEMTPKLTSKSTTRVRSQESEIQIPRVRDSYLKGLRFISQESEIQPVSATEANKRRYYYYYYIHATYSRYYFMSMCSSSLSLLIYSCVSVLTLQWLSSPHTLVQHGLPHDILQWLNKKN